MNEHQVSLILANVEGRLKELELTIKTLRVALMHPEEPKGAISPFVTAKEIECED